MTMLSDETVRVMIYDRKAILRRREQIAAEAPVVRETTPEDYALLRKQAAEANAAARPTRRSTKRKVHRGR